MTSDDSYGQLETVAIFSGPMPTGVTVSQNGRIFVNFPKWGDDVSATVTELQDGEAVAYPDQAWNNPAGNDDATAFVSVQSVVVDPQDRLWVLDTGSPLFQQTSEGGPKLVGFDLTDNSLVETIVFPPDVALPTSYLNDVRFDLRRGEGGFAFITDSTEQGPNGLVIVDLATGQSWRRLHAHPSVTAAGLDTYRPFVEGRPFLRHPADGQAAPVQMGSDGIAVSADGERLYYCPLSSRRLYSVSINALIDPDLDDDGVAATVRDEGDKGSGADGLESDDAGRLYITAYEQNSIIRRMPDGKYETLVHDPRLLWPDTLSMAADGYLYVTANQLHRQPAYQQGQDLRNTPYSLFRTPVDAGPVLLR